MGADASSRDAGAAASMQPRGEVTHAALIAALAARAAQHDGALRELLEARLQTLRAASPSAPTRTHDAPRGGQSALNGLLDHVAGQVQHKQPHNRDGARPAAPLPAFPTLPALEGFRDTWTKVRTDSQLRQALEQFPEDAGPLNSAVLLHRAITLMSEASPGYLRHFMTYVDALSGMEQIHDSGAVPAAEPPVGAAVKKPSRPRTRKRTE